MRTQFTGLLPLLFAVTALAGAGTAAAATAPTASTGPVTAVAPTTATVSGSVNPNGTATGYGNVTPTKDAGSGTGATAVSAPVTGLTAGRTYHFRLDATNDAGTSHGSDQTFVSSAAPTVTTKAASSVKDTSATLNGSVDPNGLATTVYFEYGTTTGYGTKTPAASAGSGTNTKSISAAVTGLTGGATYHFRLVATNATGTTNGADQ